ncbi:MAG: hypothetical protein M0Z52_09385 [Actinomycetota bacterium]|nr:hypothetical protein [Actinomycetota bacterium]
MKPGILIVDHEPDALKVLAALLRREGYDVIESISVEWSHFHTGRLKCGHGYNRHQNARQRRAGPL